MTPSGNDDLNFFYLKIFRCAAPGGSFPSPRAPYPEPRWVKKALFDLENVCFVPDAMLDAL